MVKIKHEPCKRLWCYTIEPCMQPTAMSTLVPILLLYTLTLSLYCTVCSPDKLIRSEADLGNIHLITLIKSTWFDTLDLIFPDLFDQLTLIDFIWSIWLGPFNLITYLWFNFWLDIAISFQWVGVLNETKTNLAKLSWDWAWPW